MPQSFSFSLITLVITLNQDLSLGTADIQDWIIFWGAGPDSVGVEQHPWPRPLEARSTLSLTTTDVPRHCPGESLTQTDKKNLPEFPNVLPFIRALCVSHIITMLLDLVVL